MATWIYFVLIAHGIWAICSLIDKIVISKGYIKNPLVYIVLNGLMNVFAVFLLPFVGFEPLKFTDFLIVLFFAGALFSLAVALYYKSVQYDEISRIVVLYQFGPVFVLILSFLFLGEMLTKSHFMGFLLLLGAGLVVSYKKVGNSFKLSKAFYYMLAATFLLAVSSVSVKHIYTITGFWNAFLWLRLSCFTALGVLAAPSIRKESFETFKNMKPKIKGLLLFKMVIDFSAFIFAGYAILNGPISLIAALSTSVLPLFVFILTIITSLYFPKLVKEEIDRKSMLAKLAAIALIMAGIVFINL